MIKMTEICALLKVSFKTVKGEGFYEFFCHFSSMKPEH